VFDVGFQGGFRPHSSEFDISLESVTAVAALRGSIKVTLYVAPAVQSSARRARVKSPSSENPPDKALHPTSAALLSRRSRRG
jgi:hypothetical protein